MFYKKIRRFDVIADRFDFTGKLQGIISEIVSHNSKLLSYSYVGACRFFRIILYESTSFKDINITCYSILTQDNDGIAIRSYRKILEFYVYISGT